MNDRESPFFRRQLEHLRDALFAPAVRPMRPATAPITVTVTPYHVRLSATELHRAPATCAKLIAREHQREAFRELEAQIDRDTLAELAADQRDEDLRRAAGPAYRAIGDELEARLEARRAAGTLTRAWVDALLAECKRRFAAVPNPPRREWFAPRQPLRLL